jgi:histidinol-phosphate aminotransferase
MLKFKDEKGFKEKLERLQLTGYTIGETVKSVAQRFGINPLEVVKLDANENFFIPRKSLIELMREVIEEFDPRIYPQEEECDLKEKLSGYLHVPASHIAIGNGSDELLDVFARLFLERGDQALSISPTFSMYKHSVSLQRAEILEVPLKRDFTLDTERIIAMITSKTRIVFLCSPNNPTANQFKIDEVRFLIEEFPGIVVVDEAYAEFAGYSIASLLNKFENLIVLRTFSKAFGLAGLRLGYCLTNSDLATTLSKKAGLPYPASSIALRAGLKLLTNIGIVENAVKQTKVERAKLITKLNEVGGVKTFDSQTNFVLFQTGKRSDEVYQGLLRRGVLVKNLGNILHLNNCFRTTVGLPEMNAKLLKALQEICGDQK